MLAQLGPSNDRIVVKNKKGQILKPPIHKWDQSPKGTQSTSMAIAVGSYFVSGRNDPLSQMASSPSSISQEGDYLMIALNHPIIEIPAAEQPKENGQR